MMKKVVSLVLALIFVFSLSVSALAATNNTVPSIEIKPAPEIIEAKEKGGMVLTAYLYVTGYSERETGGDPDMSLEVREIVKENLEDAFEEITSVQKLGDIDKELEDMAKAINPKYNSSVFSATHLFDITASQQYVDLLDIPENFIRVTFDYKVNSDEDIPVIMYRDDKTNVWKVINRKLTSRNSEGYLVVDFYGLCPVVFLSVAKDKADALINGGKTDVVTGDNSNIVIYIILLVAAILLLAATIIWKKRSNVSNDVPVVTEPPVDKE